MSEIIYQFSSALQAAYSSVHAELAAAENDTQTNLTLPENDIRGYRNLNSEEKKILLDKSTFKFAAAQFHKYFPPHYFKARYLLDNLIQEDVLNTWVNNNSHLVLIDAGCGAGAASAAYIQKLSEICQSKGEQRYLHCLAFDPDKYALVLYNKLLKNFLARLDCPNLVVDFSPLPLGIPALNPLINQLDLKRKEWDIPRIPHVLLFRMNIDKPLSKRYYEQKEQEEFLKSYGVPIIEEVNYGGEEADSYETVLRNAAIDRLNVVAVATRNNDGSKPNTEQSQDHSLEQRLKEFSDSLELVCEKYGHSSSRIECCGYTTNFINPQDSYYATKQQVGTTTYFATANFITDKSLIKDIRWEEILSVKNLQTAWARARRNLLHEALYDEVEIRLFESQLELNLSNLSNRLANYVNHIFLIDQNIPFKTLKASGDKRPRSLSRLEEEILFSALIQDVSIEYAGRYPNSYAYQIKNAGSRANEYLYTDWFDGYTKYTQDAANAALKYSLTGAVIQTDLKKFYEKIIQERLREISANELYKYSDRIEWLLKGLIDRRYLEHDEGKGLAQGSIGSGFFANLYLSSLHRFFQDMDVEFFRYVDDMIIVVKDADEVAMILEKLENFVNDELGLELNRDKTSIYYNIDDFVRNVGRNSDLNELHHKHQNFLNLVWYGDPEFRTELKYAYLSDDTWWEYLKTYQKCLASISIFVDLTTLSRRTRLNLFNEENVAKHLHDTQGITIPYFPEIVDEKGINNWVQGFHEFNPDYVRELKYHRQELYKAFIDTYKSINLNDIDKKDASRLRFLINKLSNVGISRIRNELVEIILKAPWLLELSYTFENMALNGLYEELDTILDYYNKERVTSDREYVMSMALKSVRYFPELSEKNIKRLFEYGTRSPSLIERLMATETILIRREIIPAKVLEKYLPAIANQIKGDALNPRLEKNYILMLGKQVPSTYSPSPTDDMLRNAKYIALNDNAESLFKDVEHPILRRQFYGAFDTQEEYRYFG